VLSAAFPERAATHVPAAEAAWENQLHCLRALTVLANKTRGQAKFDTRPTHKSGCRLRQQPFACPVNQAQALVSIKRKNSHIDFRHYGAQKRSGFHRAQALIAQGLAQVVNFQHDFAKRVAHGCTATADGIVALANGGENI
jgi:hypothetical protein